MKRALVLGALLGSLVACARPAPLSPLPGAGPAAALRKSQSPLDPRRLRGAESFGKSAVVAIEAGIAGDRVSAVIEAPRDSCVVVIARGSSSIEDLDLLAYGEDGAPLGSDEAADREPSLLICPPHPGRILLAARIAQGHGIVAVGSESVAPALAAQAAERYRVKLREPGEGPRLKAWPGLDEMVLRERRRVGGKFQDLRRVAVVLDASAPTLLPATVDAGRCVHGLFVPSDDVSHLDVAALDDHGRVLGRAAGTGRQRTVLVCSPVTSEISFEIRPHSGRGLAVAALSRSVPGSESELEGEVIRRDVYPSGALSAEVTRLSENLEKLGYKAPRSLVPKLELQVGRRSSTKLGLAEGCTRIDVVGAAPLRGLEARLWNDAGQLLAEGSGGGALTLFGCGAGKLRLDTSAHVAPGPVAVLLSREADAPASSPGRRSPVVGS